MVLGLWFQNISTTLFLVILEKRASRSLAKSGLYIYIYIFGVSGGSGLETQHFKWANAWQTWFHTKNQTSLRILYRKTVLISNPELKPRSSHIETDFIYSRLIRFMWNSSEEWKLVVVRNRDFQTEMWKRCSCNVRTYTYMSCMCTCFYFMKLSVIWLYECIPLEPQSRAESRPKCTRVFF